MQSLRGAKALGSIFAAAAIIATIPLAAMAAAGAEPRSDPVPTSIPVITWHELNNGCLSTATVCNAADPESVSTTQLTSELSYLKAQGYHSVTPSQYMSWAQGAKVTLPTNPVLLIADNGIENFLSGSQKVLQQDGFTLTVAVISGFADGASGTCSEPAFEGGCPAANEGGGWDATWSQLAALPSLTYNFIIEAGTAGHFVQTYDPACTAFYACMLKGETTAAYESRVQGDLSAGLNEITSKLGHSRVTSGLWVVPYSDAGYTACTQAGCTPQPYDGPAGWLASWTASTYPVAFVEDAFRNGLQHERFRIDVQGWMTQTQFQTTLTQDVAAGDFTLTNTPPPVVPPPPPPPPPPPVLPPPPPPPPTSTTPVAALPVLSLDSTTMTAAQVEAQLAYLRAQGYNTVTSGSYETWTTGAAVALPAHPIMLTFTGDNNALLTAITPYLVSDGYSAVDFVSTQHVDAGGASTTWATLSTLAPAAWQFSFGSGASGGTPVTSDPAACNIYYACLASNESATTYENRVANEIGAGRLELDNGLWMQTVNDDLWSAPFGDAGQPGQPYNGPVGWLATWASYVFPVVFVSGGASGNNEHNVLALVGSTTEAAFQTALSAELANGTFNG
ncbi:MAG TPA: hypothetical protein VGL48_01805 [Acidimicrobiales bacterium]